MNYPELLQNIYHVGAPVDPRGEITRELMNVRLRVLPRENLFTFGEARSLDRITGYWMKELAWYMSGNRSAEFIEQHANLWKEIKNPDNTLNSNYGHLVFYNKTAHPSLDEGATECLTPFAWARESLIKDKNSRQAVITYNTGGFNFLGNKDYICTQHQAFFIRGNMLRCFVALRSSDVIWGLPYNMLWWSFVQQQLFHALKGFYPDLMLGSIEATIYSAHLYQRHYELVKRMLAAGTPQAHRMRANRIPLGQNLQWYLDSLQSQVSFEEVDNERD